MEITIDSPDAVWLGSELYCKTPEALKIALRTLRAMGYKIKDERKGDKASRNGLTKKEMEQEGWPLWYASLDSRRLKCKTCLNYIEQRGIAMHGHTCEICGAITRLDLVPGDRVKFQFDQKWLGPELLMEVIEWDTENAWLYLTPNPIHGGTFIVSGDEATAYLQEFSDRWEIVEHNGLPALKVRYAYTPLGTTDEFAVIHEMSMLGGRDNYTEVDVWDGEEFERYDLEHKLPVPTSISIHESWRWAPLPPTKDLYETIISAGGRNSDPKWYTYTMFSPQNDWNRANYQRMGVFIRHFTTLDADLWDEVSNYFSLHGPTGIAQVQEFIEDAIESSADLEAVSTLPE